MQLFRTLMWVLVAALLVTFVIMNSAFTGSESVSVRFWPQADGRWFQLHWPVGLIVLGSMAAGFLPMWLIHKGARWRLNRRIGFLENSMKASSQTPPLATSTQLEAAAQDTPAPLP